MPIRQRIGNSDLEITPVALGGNVFGWTADRAASFEVLDGFLVGGGDLVDSADSYSHWVPGHTGGESETIIGEWMASRGNRDRVTVATKVYSHPEFRGLAAANVRAAADASLTRLGTDRIDLYYAHHDDENTPLEETVAAFSGLVDAGKIRAIGLSNFTAPRLEEWVSIAKAGGYHAPVALQPHYNLVERGFETDGLREAVERTGLGVFPYYSLAEGFLAGKYRKVADGAASGASERAEDAVRYLDDRGRRVLAALDRVTAARSAAAQGVTAAHSAAARGAADAHDVEVASVSLAWLRMQPTVVAPIVSVSKISQLPALLASASLELTDAELEELSAASA